MVNFGKIPILPINKGSLLKKVIRVVKTVFDIITNKLPKDISNMDSVNSKSSADEISRVSEIFQKYRAEIYQQTSDIEKSVYDEVNYYMDELLLLLEQKEDVLQKYSIRTKRIEKKIQKILAGVNGSIDRELANYISLDNSECKEILKMIPGSKKDEAMSEFTKNSMKLVLNKCCENIRERLNDIFEELEEQISDKIEIVKQDMELNMHNMEQIDTENLVEQTAVLMNESIEIIAVCDNICELLEV
ncbi:MAG: hypothetical protein MR487_12730 [Lachnospiraceae bacterium]|nr:hypothetical protein [Lachnospiraceae bacterium]